MRMRISPRAFGSGASGSEQEADTHSQLPHKDVTCVTDPVARPA